AGQRLAARVPEPDLGLAARALVGADAPDLVDQLPLVPVQPGPGPPAYRAELGRSLAWFTHARKTHGSRNWFMLQPMTAIRSPSWMTSPSATASRVSLPPPSAST